MIDKLATAALVVSVAAAAFSFGVSDVGNKTRAAIFYGDTPAMQRVQAALVVTDLVPGEPIRYNLKADKRSDCYPPDGKAEIDYRVWFVEDDGQMARRIELPYHRQSILKPGVASALPTPTSIPLPVLDAGCYAFQWTGHYTCKSASEVQSIDGPLLRFRVYQDGHPIPACR